MLASSFFRPLGARSHAVMDGFSTDELATVARFLRGMADAFAAHHREVRSSG